MEMRPSCIYMSTSTITKGYRYQNSIGKLCTIPRAKLALSLWESTIHMFLTRREIFLSVMMSAQKFLGYSGIGKMLRKGTLIVVKLMIFDPQSKPSHSFQ